MVDSAVPGTNEVNGSKKGRRRRNAIVVYGYPSMLSIVVILEVPGTLSYKRCFATILVN
jgi:hypothetical protein